jgi:hypothetical protein
MVFRIALRHVYIGMKTITYGEKLVHFAVILQM